MDVDGEANQGNEETLGSAALLLKKLKTAVKTSHNYQEAAWEKGQAVDQSVVRKLVLSYLLHNCFSETAKALLEDFKTSHPSASQPQEAHTFSPMNVEEMCGSQFSECRKVLLEGETGSFLGQEIAGPFETMNTRKKVMDLILDGCVQEAIHLCLEEFPGLLSTVKENSPSSSRRVYFQLLCQKFVELIRDGDSGLALTFAQSELNCFGKESHEFLDILQDIIALLAYEDPFNSPVRDYLHFDRRAEVAEMVNKAILLYKNSTADLVMETVLKQLSLTMDILSEGDGNGQWQLNSLLS
eukprot:Sdes_comp18692_c0_seq1m8984